MEYKREISVVVPEYCGASMIPQLLERLHKSLSPITNNYEVILVNDCSPDNTWEEIVRFAKDDTHVVGLNLARNCGQQNAITAGCKYAKGRYVVVMDCDLQNRPEDLPALYNKALEGYDIVYARRVKKQFGWWKTKTSAWFHRVYDWMADSKTDESIAEFGIYSGRVIAAYNSMREVSRSFGFLISYLGFKSTAIEIQHDARAEGETSYTLSKLIKLAFDTIITNSTKPLIIAVIVGFILSTVSFLMAVYNVIAYFFDMAIVRGYTSTIFSIWFATGILLFMMGILGLYIGKIFEQVKERPMYIVMDEINTEIDKIE